MARPSKPSLFERKLKELEQQQELIQNDIRTLSKSMRKLDEGGEMPPLRSRSIDAVRAARAAVAAEPAPVRRAPAPVSPPPPEPAPDLDPEPEALGEPAPDLEPVPDADDGSDAPPLIVDTRRFPPPVRPKFANYFASGSFGSSRPLAEERRIQRNKAIFMVVVLVLVLAIVLRFIL